MDTFSSITYWNTCINIKLCVNIILFLLFPFKFSNLWRSWLTQCAKTRKVAGSIIDFLTGIFHWHNPFGRTIVLGVDITSDRNEYYKYFPGGKEGRCVGLTTLPPSCVDCHEIWKPQPPGNLNPFNSTVTSKIYHFYLFIFSLKLWNPFEIELSGLCFVTGGHQSHWKHTLCFTIT
jgi:hypothetical protein